MKKIYLLTTGVCLSMTVFAQSPGGVAGASLWLKADAAPTLNLSGSNVNTWTYFNDGTKLFTFVAGAQPTLVANAINSLPGVSFNGSKMDGPTGANAPIAAGSQAYAVIAVWSTASAASPQRPWSQWDSTAVPAQGNGTSMWLYNPGGGLEFGDQPEISPYTQGVSRPVTTGTFYISEMNLLNATSNDLELTDQNNLSSGPAVLSTGNGTNARANLSTVSHALGCRENVTDEPFDGTLEELIVYPFNVNAGASQNQIFSYLSMKYGIPIGIGLVASDGATKPWDATLGGGSYNNRVIGVGIDNGSGLNVQSTGIAGAAGVPGAGNITMAAQDPLVNNLSFLMIGDDNGSLTELAPGTDVPASATTSRRLARNWYVQNTGPAGRVNMTFDFTGISTTGTVGTTSDFRLMVNDNADPTFASGNTTYFTPSSFTGNVANFTAVTLPTNNVFAIISDASGATPLPVDFVKFTAQADDGNVDLSWVVADNEQASDYAVERSSDGVAYTKIGDVANNVNQTDYSFVDQNTGPGTHFYRVLETDQNGESIYSPVARVSPAGDFSIKVLNNPSAGITEAQLQINAVRSGNAFVELWSAGGARINLMEQAIGTGPNTISVPMASLPAGSYVLKVMVNNVTKTVQVVKL